MVITVLIRQVYEKRSALSAASQGLHFVMDWCRLFHALDDKAKEKTKNFVANNMDHGWIQLFYVLNQVLCNFDAIRCLNSKDVYLSCESMKDLINYKLNNKLQPYCYVLTALFFVAPSLWAKTSKYSRHSQKTLEGEQGQLQHLFPPCSWVQYPFFSSSIAKI